ncbi:MAG: exodeoxyribonuclease III [Smithellaceae bacterium]|nr:exodeoxyribonuclease III [Smithellaceae bacterium]
MRTFKIASFNVNSIRSRLDIVVPWLERNHPDCLCMQETKVRDDSFPVDDFKACGYHVVFRGRGQYNGVALASRVEPKNVIYGLAVDGPEDDDRLIAAGITGVTVVNTYVPQGHDKDSPQFAYKLKWYDRFRDFLNRTYSPSQPLIWCGDLNVAPESIDVHDPKRLLGHVCFNPQVWDAFAAVRSWGLEDIFRKYHPGEAGQYTFFDYRVPDAVSRAKGWRVDHILATKSLAAKSLSCKIDMAPRLAPKPSDHTVIMAEFQI